MEARLKGMSSGEARPGSISGRTESIVLVEDEFMPEEQTLLLNGYKDAADLLRECWFELYKTMVSPPFADSDMSACSLQTFNSCAFSNRGTGKNNLALHQDFETSVVSTDLSSTVGSHGPMDLPTSEFSGDVNVCSDGLNKLEI
ncbi:hypothetical protein Droror1_Dr00019943 [Drosera rotundifolia]